MQQNGRKSLWAEAGYRWSSVEPLETRVAPAAILVSNLNDDGSGSLRAAVEQANEAPGEDIITFQAGLKGTIKLRSELSILDDLEIEGGKKITLNGLNKTRHFSIQGFYSYDLLSTVTPDVTLSGLKLVKGRATETGGGSIFIENSGGTVTIKNSVISGNRSIGVVDDANYIYNTTAAGGAIANLAGTLIVENTKITNNRALAILGGEATGGAIFNGSDGDLTLVNSIVSGNTAVGGKGSAGSKGDKGYRGDDGYDLGAEGSTGSPGGDGYAGGSGGIASGGGIHNSGTLLIQKSTISGNTVTGGDGGKGGVGGNGGRGGQGGPGGSYYGQRYSPGIGGSGGDGGLGGDGGSAGAGRGGGVFSADGTITIESSTISGNTAKSGKAGAGGAGGAGGLPGPRGPASSGGGGGYEYEYSAGSTLTQSTISGATLQIQDGEDRTRGYYGYEEPKPGKPGKRGDKGFRGESSYGLGGGIYVGGGVLRAIQVTIAKNSASDGGGIAVLTSEALISNSTIAFNKAKSGGGILTGSDFEQAIQVVSTVVGGNKASDGPDLAGLGSIEASFSLFQKQGSVTVTGDDNLLGENPLLGKLKKNGGSTATILPKRNSPLLDAGSNPEALNEDQRGLSREQGAQTDIGATEVPVATA